MAIAKEKNIDNSMLKKLNKYNVGIEKEPRQVINRTGKVIQLVNAETGEVLDTLKDGDRIVRAESADSYFEIIKGVKYKDTAHFIKMGRMRNKELITMMKEKKLSIQAYGLICAMSTFLDRSGDNIVKINGKKAGYKQIAEEVGYSTRGFQNTLTELKSHKIVKEMAGGKEKHLSINPIYFNRGVVTEQTIVEFFDNVPEQFVMTKDKDEE